MVGNVRRVFVLLVAILLVSCTQAPPVNQSRDQLWAKYDNQSVDTVLLAMGPPDRESHLTDGSRLLTYQFSSVYDYGSPYERQAGCEVSFIAKAPSYKIKNIAMQGGNYECNMLAQGRTGIIRHPYIPPPTPYAPYYR